VPPLRLAAVVAAAAASLLLPTALQAALPLPRAQFEAHDHTTPGDGYHVQLQVGRQRRRADFLLVYAQKCNATPYVSNLPISESGRLSVSLTFTTL
jgi:hypothetical protein